MFQMFKNKIKALNSLRGLKNGKSYVYSYSRVHIDNILHPRVKKNVYVYSPDDFLKMSMNRHFFTLMSENN